MPRRFYDPRAPRLLPSVVCVADLLGYRALLSAEGDSFNTALRDLKRALDDAYRALRAHADASDAGPFFSTKTFTDNVVVGCPLTFPDMDAESETAIVFMAFAEHQLRLAAAGFFVRGGIAFGGLYMDEDIVFGPALIEAHELDQSGQPPRLCLADSQLQVVKQHLTYYSPGAAPHGEQLLRDQDGRVFLNYLAAAFEDFPEAPVDHKLIAAHGRQISARLTDPALSSQVRAKYAWAGRYHNYVLRTFAKRYGGKADASQDAAEARGVLRHTVDVPAGPEPQAFSD